MQENYCRTYTAWIVLYLAIIHFGIVLVLMISF